jgi:hypothetical protein
MALTCLLQACNPIGFIEANRLLKEDENAFLAAKADFVINRSLALAPNEVIAATGEQELNYRLKSLSADQLVMQRSGHEFSIPDAPTWLLRGWSVDLKFEIERKGGRLVKTEANQKTVGKSIEVNRAVQGRFETVRITVRDGSEITAQFNGWFPSSAADPVKSSVATKALYNQIHHPFTSNQQPVSIESSLVKIHKFLAEAFVKPQPTVKHQTIYRAAIIEDTKYHKPIEFDQRAPPPEKGDHWDQRCDDFLAFTTRLSFGGYSYRFLNSTSQAQVIVRSGASLHCHGGEVFIVHDENSNNVLDRYSKAGEFLERLKLEQETDLRIVLASGGPFVNPTSFERVGTSYRWTYLFVNGASKYHWQRGKLNTLPVSRRIDIEVMRKGP